MQSDASPHIPVLLGPLLDAVAPVSGHWVDGTLGAGGYSKGLLKAGAAKVTGIDRDPLALAMAADWAGEYGDRFKGIEGNFAELDRLAEAPVDGVALDLGVSSMQLDDRVRGFSFQGDGPLDMRMGRDGQSAADLVNTASEQELADVLYHFGEERASRRIAKAIVSARSLAPIGTTGKLAEITALALPRPKPGQSHPATRTFQAIRIAVNGEFEALVGGLEAAERALKPGGYFAVVTFHSLEDRIVKRFFQARSGGLGQANRHMPRVETEAPRFRIATKAIAPTVDEVAANPRARSARLRIGIRTDALSSPVDRRLLGLPKIVGADR
ncbi:MAG: 16S rRNA (cytosine(1402)-N(4))-methyltransferase RsmH [Pseudomonadota bacterium]